MVRAPFYPLLFAPVYKEYLWGGQRIAARYGRAGAPPVCAESWEISAHPDGPSFVTNGACAGEALAALAARHGPAIVGSRALEPHRFPLLFKIIDARDNLSVQVHPGDDNAGLVGGEAKSELWYVLDRTPDAVLYAGLKPGTTAASFRAAMSDGTAPDRLFRLAVQPGEALFIPGGLVHSIGTGCLFYEIQQASNSTYRLYDWGRFDASGQPRPLHIQQAFQVIDPSLPEPRMLRPPPAPQDGANHWTPVYAGRHFRVQRLDLRRPARVTMDGASFHALFEVAGRTAVSADGVIVPLDPGTSCLVPAGAEVFELELAGREATVLVTTLV